LIYVSKQQNNSAFKKLAPSSNRFPYYSASLNWALVQFNYAGNDLIPNKKKLFKKFYFCIAMPTP